MNDEQRPIRPEDRAHDEWLMRERSLTLRAMVLTLAVCFAPFLALPFGFTPALSVLATGLFLTAWLCWSGAGQVSSGSRGRLRTAAAMNLTLSLLVFGIVALRVL